MLVNVTAVTAAFDDFIEEWPPYILNGGTFSGHMLPGSLFLYWGLRRWVMLARAPDPVRIRDVPPSWFIALCATLGIAGELSIDTNYQLSSTAPWDCYADDLRAQCPVFRRTYFSASMNNWEHAAMYSGFLVAGGFPRAALRVHAHGSAMAATRTPCQTRQKWAE